MSVNPKTLRATLVGLALALLFIVAWWLWPKAYHFSDPVGYLLRAWNLADIGQWGALGFRRWAFEWAHSAEADPLPFDYRLGLLLPHWLAYKLFGPGDVASFLPQLVFLLIILFAVLRYCDTLLQKLCAAAVLALLLPFSADVYPDLGVACFMFLALCLLRRGVGEGGAAPGSSRRQALYGAAFSLVAFYAMLIKLTAYFLIAPFLFALLSPWARGGRDGIGAFYASAMLSGFALLVAYAVLCHYLYGDATSRLDTVNKVGARHLWAIEGWHAYARRLFIEPARFFFGLYGVAFFLALAQAVRTLAARAERDGLRLVAVYFLAGIVFGVFTPTSLRDWQPLPLSERMFLFLAPALAVLTARWLGDLWNWRPRQTTGPRQALARYAPRAAAGALLLAAAQPGALAFYQSVVNAHPSSAEQARRMATRLLREHDNAVLLTAEDRSYEHLVVYAGFDEAFYRRARHCGPPPAEGAHLVVYIDRGLGRFIERAYGRRACIDALLELAAARGLATLIDDGNIHLSATRRDSANPRP